jgi:RimJ/RimL family protein N-acetyltransferase
MRTSAPRCTCGASSRVPLTARALPVFLETERLVLRRFTTADADNLGGLDADPDRLHRVWRAARDRGSDGRERASRRVMEKAGLTLVRTFHQPWPDAIGSHELEVVEYALHEADWEQQDQGRTSAAAQH